MFRNQLLNSIKWVAVQLIVLQSATTVNGQEAIPIGTWRSHFNYQSTNIVLEAGPKIYAATPNGFFFYDTEDNSVNRLSKVDGFSDVGISAMGFEPSAEALVIGYGSGNIDIFDGRAITNLDFIKNEPITGSKAINEICIRQGRAYLATDFGVVVLNIERADIQESWENLGPNGESIAINSCAIKEDTIFLGTSMGVIAGKLSPQVNLLDFRNWTRFESGLPVDEDNVDVLGSQGAVVLAGISDEALYQYQSGNWELVSEVAVNATIFSIRANDSDFLVAMEDRLLQYRANGTATTINYLSEPQSRMAIYDRGNTLWIADAGEGLIREIGDGFEIFDINGPAGFTAFKLRVLDGKVYSLFGGYDQQFTRDMNFDGYSTFESGVWRTTIPGDGTIFGDMVDATFVPTESLTFIASFGDGLYLPESEEVIDDETPGSPLQNANPPQRAVQISGVATNRSGQVWITNFDSPVPLHKYDPGTGEWESFSFQGATASNFPLDVNISEAEEPWMRLNFSSGGGILVFNEELNAFRRITNAEGNGALPSLNVTSLVFDQEGLPWIGTDAGVAFIPNPFGIFDNQNFDAIRPIFEGRFLLEDELITAMAVDGGNRKWIGTPEGLWLFEEAGETLVENFTIENSPLPSNNIVSITIDPTSGEVFIATDLGIVSYRGTSTEGRRTNQNVKIFPNPVNPDFSGEVGISGLANNSIVKITDIGGRLVKEVQAEGGTATWNARDLNGNKVATGVYLVWSATRSGDETFVGKLAVIE